MSRSTIEGNPRGASRRQLFKRAAANVAWYTGIFAGGVGGGDVGVVLKKSAENLVRGEKLEDGPAVVQVVYGVGEIAVGFAVMVAAGRVLGKINK